MNQEKMLISVVVVCYNCEKYVIDCLISIFNQTYQNLELIITYDASNDNTVGVVKSWLQKNGQRFIRYEVISSERNTGVSANCNRGLFASYGEWIKYIAADDLLYPACVEEYINYIKGNAAAKIVFSKPSLFHNIIGDMENGNSTSALGMYFWDRAKSAQDQLKMLLRFNRVSACTSFINCKLLKDVGGYDEDIPMVEDIPMWIRLTSMGHKLYYLNQQLVGYRKSENSLTSQTVNFAKINICQIKQYLLILEKYRLPMSSGMNSFINKIDYFLTSKTVEYCDESNLLYRFFFLSSRMWSHVVKFISLYVLKS